MVADEQVKAIALFFFLSFMDEELALQASEKAIAQLKVKKGSALPSVDEVTLVRLLRQKYDQYKDQLKDTARRPAKPNANLSWVESSQVHLEAWSKFHQEAHPHEVVAVVLSRVLGFRDETIASGLGISLGTTQHRIGKGIRNLGAHMKGAEA